MHTKHDSSFPQFTQEQVDLMASGNDATFRDVCYWLFYHFDSIVRHLAAKINGTFRREDVEDLVVVYWRTKFLSLCRYCRSEKMTAERFNALFYSSLYHTAEKLLGRSTFSAR